MARRRGKLPQEPVSAKIESLSHAGQGITHVSGKMVLVNGALPGEDALFQYKKQRAKYDEAAVIEVVNPAPERVDAKCEFFGLCGGCSLQHMQHEFQIEHKQSVLIEKLTQIGKVKPQSVILPLVKSQWGYRRKARLGVKYVDKKERVLVGFREKYNSFVADINRCEVLHPSVGILIEPLQRLITVLSLIKHIPQIEVAMGDEVTALIFRHLASFNDDDISKLQAFSAQHEVDIYLQSSDPGSIVPLVGTSPGQLFYTLPEFDVTLNFLPTDFTQVNFEMNRAMVVRTLDLLEVNSEDRVLDLFCGIGNFTLPLARRALGVLGVERESGLVERARQNAAFNKIGNVEFREVDLTRDHVLDGMKNEEFIQGGFNKLLLDPARNGAREVIEKMNFNRVERMVYVSCNPSTLARDAGILVNDKGFRLEQVGVMDMFPHTTHVESIAVFHR